MKITLEFVNRRLREMGSRCEPVTHRDERNGMKPKGDFLLKAGLLLERIYSDDHISFQMVEKIGENRIEIRDFPYTRMELDTMFADLSLAMKDGKDGYALEWNYYQVRRALLLMDMDAPKRQMNVLLGQAERTPIVVGGTDQNAPYL